jgi:F-type H+-transporting ATPase subunit b
LSFNQESFVDINSTLLGELITFALFVAFTMKFVWPHLTKALAERQARIAEGLAAGERGREALEVAKHHVAEELRVAKAKAAEIVEEANRRANQIIEAAKGDAREEGQRLINAAHGEVEREARRARQALHAEVVAIAVKGAEKILERSIDANAQKGLIDKMLADIS